MTYPSLPPEVRHIHPTRLRAEGRSLCFTVPAAVARQLGIKAGDLVIVRAKDGALVAAKVDIRRAMEVVDGVRV